MRSEEEDQDVDMEGTDRTPLVVLPYVAGVSEDIRRVCSRFGIRAVFKSGQTLRLMLTKVKDTLLLGKRLRVVYEIPCGCGQVYIGETIRRLETRMREHQDACERGTFEKSAVAEHAWKRHHPIKWEDTTVLAQAKGYKELRLKEVFTSGGYLSAIDLTMILDWNCQIAGEQPSGGFKTIRNSEGPGPPL